MWLATALLTINVRCALASHHYEHDLADLGTACEICLHVHISTDDALGPALYGFDVVKPRSLVLAKPIEPHGRDKKFNCARGPPTNIT